MSRLVALTGATGFAGRHAVAELLRHGHRVRALVRDPAAAALPGGVATVTGDLDDDDALFRLVDGADAVVHLAGAIAALDRRDYFRVNAQGAVGVAGAAVRMGTPRFVHVSSLSAREPRLSHYAGSKRAGEDAVMALADKLHAIVLRPPAVYGPGDKGTLPLIRELTKPVAAIPGRRDARFSLIHVRDLARLIVACAGDIASGLHEVSDGTAGGYGWDDLAAAASAFRGAPVRPLFLPRTIPAAVALGAEAFARLTGKAGLVNSGKIRELYHRDWVCREGSLQLADATRFAQGFAETVEWYREAGWLPRGRGADTSGGNPEIRR